MAEQKRISEVMLETLRDIALSYGIAVLALPMLHGCNRAGQLQPWLAFTVVSAFALLLSEVAIYRWITDLRRRCKHKWLQLTVMLAVAIPLIVANSAAFLVITDPDYHPLTKKPIVDSAVSYFVDRYAFMQKCTPGH